jgi:glycosyltransferase involved in cell wall biosynthesis
VLIPTYNNARTIAKVIEDVSTYCNDIFIVNDGSTDDTLSKIAPYKETIRLIDYPKNQGKGHALITGFRHAYAEGFRYAVTIDSDGQHFADDLPVFLEMLEKEPGTVIIGARQIKKNDQSGGSNFANKFSNFWFKAETGLTLSDTQSGYRLYPLEPISKMRFYSKKYEFEIEVIVRLAWKGIKVLNVPIAVFYPSKNFLAIFLCQNF